MHINFETSTGYWINLKEFTPASYINLKSKLSTLDFKENEVPVAFFEYTDDDEKFVVIPKIKRELLFFILGKKIIFQTTEIDTHDTVSYKTPKFTPTEHQKPIIDKILSNWQSEYTTDPRAVISLPPGGGKSFVSAYLISKMKRKFIFVVYSAKLITQTYTSFCEFLGREGLLVLEKSKDFDDIRWDKVKGLFVSHSMLRTLYKTYSFEHVLSVLHDKLGADIVVYDEFDREMGSLYKLQAFSNFKYNLYLTGTPFRSLHEDDRVMQLIFKPVLSLGGDSNLTINKELHIINYKFTPTPKEWTQMQLNNDKNFKLAYNRYISKKDILLDFIMNQFYKKEKSIIRNILEEKGQIIIYAGLIENCISVKEKLINHFEIDENDIGVYNSDISDREKEEAEKKKWIISTCESLGRGYDNKNIRVLIYLEFSFSLSTWLQTIARVGRLGGSRGYVIYGLDHSFHKVQMNWDKRVRHGTIETNFDKVFNYTIPDSWKDYYVYGYRRTSAMAAEIMKEQKERERTLKWSKRI